MTLNRKTNFIEIENKVVVASGCGGGRNRVMSVKEYKLSVIRSSKGLEYSMVTVVNNMIL